MVGIAGIACSFLLAWFFRKYTDAAFPAVDSTLAAFSVVAQILLTRKKIENWVIWFVADIIYVWLYFTKGAYLTAAVYLVLIFLAAQGFYEWRKTARAAWFLCTFFFDAAIEQVNDAGTVGGIFLGVRNLDNGGAFLV